MTDNTVDEETAARLARRPWIATPIRSDLEVSFEFFPPPSRAGWDQLASCVAELSTLDPSFVSVTYGAVGSTQHRTIRTIETLIGATDLDVAGHLTCVAATTDEIHGVLDSYVAAGVRRIVALRGDASVGCEDGVVPGGYTSAEELVAGIRGRDDGDTFDISVAAYPEIHPKADSAHADLDNLKRKFDAGADRAITQFFFDSDVFLRFLDTARAGGVVGPIVAGIMPITDFGRIVDFAKKCGTSIPDWMHELFGDLDDAPEIRRMIAATVAAEQCRYLCERGVRQFHFYTLNRPELAAAICRMLGIRPRLADANIVHLVS
jgi:methylenetetrahydrofolate reductase (NADPH)